MNFAKKALVTSVQFVKAHQLPIAIVTTATVTAVVVKKVYGEAYEAAEQFIDSKGLTEEFVNFLPTDN